MEKFDRSRRKTWLFKNKYISLLFGLNQSSYGYIWSYEKTDNITYTNKNIKKQKCIYQFSKDMTFISKWDNLESIENNLGFNRSAISACCRCKSKTAYGYIWRYEENLDKEISLVSAQAKPVLQLDKDYNIVAKFPSIAEAQRSTGIANISNCCRGTRQTSNGYIWIYEKDYDSFDKQKHIDSCIHIKEVNQYDLDMNYIKTYKSITEAANDVNGYRYMITSCCKGETSNAYGYIWRYASDFKKMAC